MKISTKTGIINSIAFSVLSILAVFFFFISAQNTVIESQRNDILLTAEHFFMAPESPGAQRGQGRNAINNRYSRLSENILVAEREEDGLVFLQDPFNIASTINQTGIQSVEGMTFLVCNYKTKGKDYLVAGDITPEYQTVQSLKVTSVVFVGIFILASMLLGVVTSRLSLSPWRQFLTFISGINTSRLKDRVDVKETDDEIRELELSLNQMLERLDDGFETQRRFSSDAAHELRTPVTSIKGYAQMLKRWGLQNEEIAKESVDAIVETAEEMEKMIENLLILSRLDSGAIQKEDFQTKEWIEGLKSSLTRKYPGRDLLIRTGEMPPTICSAPAYLKILIGIFVDNAVKYSPDDTSVTVELDKNEITIKDNGKGIRKEALNRIFERYYQSDPVQSHDSGPQKKSDETLTFQNSVNSEETTGAGIGLSIARKIARRLKIEITIESEINKGTTAKLILNQNDIYEKPPID